MNKENKNLANYIHTFLRERNKIISVIECDYLAEKIIKGIKDKIKQGIDTLEKIRDPQWNIEIDDKQEALNSLIGRIGDIEYITNCVPCGGEGYTSRYHSYPCHECAGKGYIEK